MTLQGLHDFIKRLTAIYIGLSFAEQVQVWSVYDHYSHVSPPCIIYMVQVLPGVVFLLA